MAKKRWTVGGFNMQEALGISRRAFALLGSARSFDNLVLKYQDKEELKI